MRLLNKTDISSRIKNKIEKENNSFKQFEGDKAGDDFKKSSICLVRPKVFNFRKEVKNYIDSTEGQKLISIEYKINQILIEDVNDEEINSNVVNSILDEISAGLSFYEATEKYSKLYGSENNGNLGWRFKSQIPTLFVGHLDKLEKNEVFGPIKSGAGIHIIQLEDIRGDTIQTESQTLVQHVLITESEIEAKNKQKI